MVINTITATNAVTVSNELPGASAGLPNQQFVLANTPVLPGTLILDVDEGNGFTTWTEVSDFAGSKPTDTSYTLNIATGTITFGNGQQGKIPASIFYSTEAGGYFTAASGAVGDELPNIRATTYRWGGGAAGNSGANTITSLQSSVPFVASVTNLRPSIGGQDEESVDDAIERAPQTIRSGSRAVTTSDFEFIATQAPGARIRRAKALPLRNPTLEPIRPAGSGLAAASLPVPEGTGARWCL